MPMETKYLAWNTKKSEKTLKKNFQYALCQARTSIYGGNDLQGTKVKGPDEFSEDLFFLVDSGSSALCASVLQESEKCTF